ncbi:hypothetical protein [Lactobacillus johnsonii]|uniref:hypothetical protein n=1 Tax=Lactobacillus johnsonii TaxID=33959 RepID=UPI0021A4F80C|nr:hypothetical protein [Lactobacillus johnsonii]MCT3385506.1 hypothetical protein [Lactobacillus johnsonii]
MKDINLVDKDINLDLVEGTDEVVQSGTIILSTRRGEFDLVPELGTDRSSLLGKGFSKEIAASDIYDALRQDDRFNSIHTTVVEDRDSRSATIHLTATVKEQQVEMEVDYA